MTLTVFETIEVNACDLPSTVLQVDRELQQFTSKLIIDRVAGEIIRLVASMCVRVSVRLSVVALLFEPFDL